MSNYTPVTNFLAKDSLISGNPAKAVKGADLTTEFTAVQTAINSKTDGSVSFFPDGSATQPSVGFTNTSGTGMYQASGVLGLATAGLARVTISTAGASVFTPTSGVAATFNGAATANAVLINGSSTSGQSFGMNIVAGTTTADAALNIVNQAGTVQFLRIYGSGGMTIGTPTNGDPGLGGLNLAGALLINSAPVYSGVPQHQYGTSSTLVLSDANKQIINGGASVLTLTIPANASVPYPIGTLITFSCLPTALGGGASMNIACNDTMYLSPGGTATGTRSLAAGGSATAQKLTATVWMVSGTGLT